MMIGRKEVGRALVFVIAVGAILGGEKVAPAEESSRITISVKADKCVMGMASLSKVATADKDVSRPDIVCIVQNPGKKAACSVGFRDGHKIKEGVAAEMLDVESLEVTDGSVVALLRSKATWISAVMDGQSRSGPALIGQMTISIASGQPVMAGRSCRATAQFSL